MKFLRLLALVAVACWPASASSQIGGLISSSQIFCPDGLPQVVNGWTQLTPSTPSSDGRSTSTGIVSVTVKVNGSLYASAPTIGFSGGGQSVAATAHAVLNNFGQVDSIVVDTPGTYTAFTNGDLSGPTVSITGGGGSGATAVANGGVSGSQQLYVSDATGNDSNQCTNALPCKTIAHAVTFLRKGMPDWVLLNKGDTFTDQSLGVANYGQSCQKPTVYTSYGTGARPIVALNSGQTGISMLGSNTHPGDYFALVGLQIYYYQADPNNVSFAATAGATVINAVDGQNPFHYQLYENNLFNYTTLSMQVPDQLDNRTGRSAVGGYYIVRRNVISNVYGRTSVHVGGMFVNQVQNPIIEENVFDMNGWNQTLIAPTSVTITIASPAVFTWNGVVNPLVNNSLIAFCTTGVLPTGLTGSINTCLTDTNRTIYCVANLSGATFNVYASPGNNGVCNTGSPTLINTTGSQSGTQTARDMDASPTIFNHHVYIEVTAFQGSNVGIGATGPAIVRGNTFTRGPSDSVQFRSGGTEDDNLFALSPQIGSLGGNTYMTSQFTNNVAVEMTNLDTAAGVLPRGDGVSTSFDNNGLINNNVVANTTVSTTGNDYGLAVGNISSNYIISGNFVCNVGNSFISNSTGTNNVFSGNTYATGSRTYAQAPCTGFGFPNPSPVNGVIGFCYNLIGGGGVGATTLDFITAALAQSKDNWNDNLTAHAMNNCIRVNNFGLPAIPAHLFP